MERPHRLGQLDGVEPHRPGAQHRGGHHGRRKWRSVEEDHRRRARRDPRAEEHHQHDGRSAQRIRVGSHARRPRSRHRRPPRRPGGSARRRRHVEGPDRFRQRHGLESHRSGAKHRGGHDGRRDGRPVEEDYCRRARRDPRAEEHDQHDGRSAQLLRGRGHARRARGRNGRTTRRPGGRQGRQRHVEGPHGLGQLHGLESHGPGAQHRRGHHRGCERRSLEEDHRRSQRRDSRAEEHDQHDGRSAQRIRVGSHARCARSRHGRPPRRTGRGQGRRRHVERSDRLRQFDGVESHRPGAQHRGRYDGGRERRLVEEDHGRSQRRDPRAEEHDQHDGRSAPIVRGRGHARGARGRYRRQVRRTGGRAGRERHVEGPDRLGQLHGREPDQSGAQHRGGDDRGRER